MSSTVSFDYLTAGNVWKKRRDRRYWTSRRIRYTGRAQRNILNALLFIAKPINIRNKVMINLILFAERVSDAYIP